MGYMYLSWCTVITIVFYGNIYCDNHGREEAHSADLEVLIEAFWNWRLQEWPEYGTKYGINTYNNKMENYTEEGFLSEKMHAEELLMRAQRITHLNEDDEISLEVLKNLLETFIDGYKYRKYSIYNSVSPLEYLISRYNKIISLAPLEIEKDYDDLLERYAQIPKQVTDIIELMKIAASEGTTAHSTSLERGLTALDSQLDLSAEESMFYAPFKEETIGQVLSGSTKTNKQNEAKAVIEDEIYPVLRTYRDYVRNEYSQYTRSEPGVGSLPGGQDFYKACLKWHLSVDMTPEQIHMKGLEEVERISKEMQNLMTKDGFSGSLKEYIDMLMADPNNFFETGEELLDEYKRIIGIVHGQLDTILVKVPQAEVTVMGTDAGVMGRYSEPPLDGSRPGIFWANIANPDQKPKFNMIALTLHEAEPGHHTQSAYAIENDMPNFRRAIEYLRYNAVPFNWLFQTAYSEGWALYAESLGEEMGSYNTPYSLFGRYASEIHRATRLVVDTGIHAFGWSIEKAEDYMKNYTTLGEIDIQNEVLRYVAWPGQACSYKIGELKITELRRTAEDILGDDFDLREFHDQILIVGPAPLSILEDHIMNWIRNHGIISGSEGLTCSLVSLIFSVIVTYLVY